MRASAPAAPDCFLPSSAAHSAHHRRLRAPTAASPALRAAGRFVRCPPAPAKRGARSGESVKGVAAFRPCHRHHAAAEDETAAPAANNHQRDVQSVASPLCTPQSTGPRCAPARCAAAASTEARPHVVAGGRPLVGAGRAPLPPHVALHLVAAHGGTHRRRCVTSHHQGRRGRGGVNLRPELRPVVAQGDLSGSVWPQ